MTATAGMLVLAVLAHGPAVAQAPTPGEFPPYEPPRTADGRPDLNGVWQSLTTANWDIEAHGAAPGPYPEILGAWGAQPGGVSIIEGGVIPYQPWALERKRERLASRTTVSVPGDGTDPPLGDPELKCWMPGVPRTMYMPYPFQIVQTPMQVTILSEYIHSVRTIFLDSEHPDDPLQQLWMGDSRGHWEGDTLVVDVNNFTGETWLDRSGNFHSDALHVVERFTRTSPNHLLYEVTLEDPEAFTESWQISMPLYRRMEPNARLLEYECHAYLETLRNDQ